MSKTFLTMLWEPQGGWREGAGYDPAIVAGVDYMLRKAVPDVRHVCICDEVYASPLQELGIETYPLWDIHGLPRLHYPRTATSWAAMAAGAAGSAWRVARCSAAPKTRCSVRVRGWLLRTPTRRACYSSLRCTARRARRR